MDPSVHSCLSGPRGTWHTGHAQECLLRAHVTPRDHGHHSPSAGGGFRLQAAPWERGWRSPSGLVWDPGAGKAGLACASLPALPGIPRAPTPRILWLRCFAGFWSKETVQEACSKPGVPGNSPQGPAVLFFLVLF